MKFPSLFKTPRYQRFNITPRYYDPVKEEIEQRTSLIKRELQLQKGDHSSAGSLHASRLSGSFKKARNSRKSSIGLMQMVIIMLLSAGLVGYLYFGNVALYIFLLVSSVLLYLKVKHIL
ncbi:hypothetical protein C900_00707 [Fulvivirga imtechensis AK7]|uniref:Uncharacterized protein n=1 Tax=Fulvivirga imtechensis AK7 TaxID=1237149 RepID=L8JGY5_9BACT|nr:hypothetical protein [Fulvivirga imtechensis]ELR68131.1 hypothetical protein C900_00707 [Fulvivirga imtechensis AK7]